MKFQPRDYVVFAFDYQIGSMIIYKGTGAWIDKYRDNMVELTISGFGFLIPEDYLILASEVNRIKNG